MTLGTQIINGDVIKVENNKYNSIISILDSDTLNKIKVNKPEGLG